MYNGIINVYKEKGYTSFDVVAKLRGILKQKKIGHTGTLDPDATGVLPVCLGKGTKLCDMLLDKDKTYKAVLIFGIATDTEDIGGNVIEKIDIESVKKEIDNEKLEAAIKSFEGEYDQIPPMYSAIKVNGKKLYQLAREGKVIERKPRRVKILDISIEKIQFPRVYFTVKCSKGTYIRSLCRDIGTRLSVPACMEQLERIKVSRFNIDDSLILSQIEKLVIENNIEKYILPVDEALADYKKVVVKNQFSKLLYNGNPIELEMLKEPYDLEINESVRIYDETGTFIAIYQLRENHQLKNVKMFYEK